MKTLFKGLFSSCHHLNHKEVYPVCEERDPWNYLSLGNAVIKIQRIACQNSCYHSDITLSFYH